MRGKPGDSPSGDDAFEPLTFGHGDAVNHLILVEHGVDGDSLFEKLVREVNLGGDVAAVDLDLHHVRLLLLQVLNLANLGVRDDADDVGVLLQGFELLVDAAVGVLLGVPGESLLLGLEPVLVEAAANLVVEVLRPHGVERSEALRRLDVADDADHDHRGGFDDGDRLEGFLLVELGPGLVHVADDVGHASLEAEEGGEMRVFAGVVPGELLAFTPGALGALLGEESKVTHSGFLELAVRHLFVVRSGSGW